MADTNNEVWTEIITPKKNLLDINLGEIWRYRDLVGLFVRRDFVAQYKQTILGPLWFFIQPLLTTAVFFVVFSKVAKISTDGVPPVLFYMSGTTLWTYFSDCFLKTSTVFNTNASIFGKVYFPRLVTPVSIVFSSMIKLAIQSCMLLLTILYYVVFQDFHLTLNWAILLLPVLIFLVAGLSLGVGIIFSSLTTKYKDLTFLLQFGVQLLMYASPVIYPVSVTEGKMRTLVMLNPITPILETLRYSLFSTGVLDINALVYSFVFMVVALGAGVVLFNQVEKSFMDTV